MVKKIIDNIYCFPITLPKSPLKYLNCYVIKAESGRSLLIDTGYSLSVSRADLVRGMQELGLKPDNTDIFITHIHADHAGNAKFLSDQGYRILMGKRDYQGVLHCHQPNFYGAIQKATDAGTPEDVMDAIFVHNPTPIMIPDLFQAETVDPGMIMEYGGHPLEVLATYGHSPGHLSLWDAQNKILFLGDHVLFDITPNIVIWTKEDDALGEYLTSLDKIKRLPVKMALPAHRNVGSTSLQDRIDELILHHHLRVQEILSILWNQPMLSAYQIASRMKWNLHAKNWDDFPASQKYFAVCECMAHLQYMKLRGIIVCSQRNNIAYYCVSKNEY